MNPLAIIAGVFALYLLLKSQSATASAVNTTGQAQSTGLQAIANALKGLSAGKSGGTKGLGSDPGMTGGTVGGGGDLSPFAGLLTDTPAQSSYLTSTVAANDTTADSSVNYSQDLTNEIGTGDTPLESSLGDLGSGFAPTLTTSDPTTDDGGTAISTSDVDLSDYDLADISDLSDFSGYDDGGDDF